MYTGLQIYNLQEQYDKWYMHLQMGPNVSKYFIEETS
jgi:hypothetical protein